MMTTAVTQLVVVEPGKPSEMPRKQRAARMGEILQSFDQMTPLLEKCYQSHSTGNWGGNVILELRLDDSGNAVQQSWDPVPNDLMRKCIEGVVLSQWFGTPAVTERFSLGFDFNQKTKSVSRLARVQLANAIIMKHEHVFMACYEETVMRSNWEGSLKIDFMLDDLGTATMAKVLGESDDEMKGCILNIMERVNFGAGATSLVTVTKTFVFEVAK